MFEKALSLNPDRPVWYSCHLSVARLGAGQPEEAITMLREVLSRGPENAEVCRFMAVLLTYEGKYEESLSMAKKAVSLEKMSPALRSMPFFIEPRMATSKSPTCGRVKIPHPPMGVQ